MFEANVQVLSKSDMDRIHHSAIEILRDVGARVSHNRMRSMLAEHGCHVNDETVLFPEQVVEDVTDIMRNPIHQDPNYIGTLPLSWSRFPKEARVIPVATGQATMVHDLSTDELRAATQSDLEDACRVIDNLPDVITGHPLFIPQDAPPMVRDLFTLITVAGHYPYSDFVEIYSPEAVPFFLEAGRVICGSEEELKNDPPFCSWAFATPPLQFGPHGFEIIFQLMDFGIEQKYGVGGVMPVLGASTPMTLAGYLVMQTAEILACNVMNWVLLGRVTGYSGGATILDMKHATPSQSSPEACLLFLSTMDMQKYYGSVEPMFPYALNSDAKFPDIQAGMDKAITASLAMVSGSRLLSTGLGCLSLSGVASLAQVVIDYELCMSLRHILKGLEVNDETIQIDLIKEVGIGGSFLAEEETVKHMRKTLYFPELFDRRAVGDWMVEKRGMLDHAKDKVQKILREDHKPQYLSEEQVSELEKITTFAQEKLG